MTFISPLRYPGGKRKLNKLFSKIILEKYPDAEEIHYLEPYAGGAGLALTLLKNGIVSNIYINDIDYAVYAFWYSVLNHTEELCQLIRETEVTINEWKLQREILDNLDGRPELEVGYSAFFLNRTNRSGILKGGVIGGKNQSGIWKLDVRFNKEDLLRRINWIAQQKARIQISNTDALDFLNTRFPEFKSQHTLLYLDPPYYVKGQSLYYNHYTAEEHKAIADKLRTCTHPWIVSYDDVPEIREIYTGYPYMTYGLHYTAQNKQQGGEIMYFSGIEISEKKQKSDWGALHTPVVKNV